MSFSGSSNGKWQTVCHVLEVCAAQLVPRTREFVAELAGVADSEGELLGAASGSMVLPEESSIAPTFSAAVD